MGQRGAAPAPVALKVLKGETRPSRLASSPGPTDPPIKPKDLAPAVAVEWERVMAAIADTRHIGEAHAVTLRHFCETVVAANAMNPKGTKEWRELVNVSRQLARELCLTPATANGLQRATPTENPLDKYRRAN